MVVGFTLTEIAELIDTEGRVAADWRERARAKGAELESVIAQLQRASDVVRHIVECPHQALHDCPVHQQIVSTHAAALPQRR